MVETAPQPRSSLLDSPWYWVYVFCTAALVALMLMGWKFGARQAQIEREYQGRERAAQHVHGLEPTTAMSTPEHTIVTLQPLYYVLGAVLLVAWIVLWWKHFRFRTARLSGRSPKGSS